MGSKEKLALQYVLCLGWTVKLKQTKAIDHLIKMKSHQENPTQIVNEQLPAMPDLLCLPPWTKERT